MKVRGVEESEGVWLSQSDNRDPTPGINVKGKGRGVGTENSLKHRRQLSRKLME